MEWSGVEWSGVEWSGVEWSGVCERDCERDVDVSMQRTASSAGMGGLAESLSSFSHLLVLCSSPLIFEETRNCSQSERNREVINLFWKERLLPVKIPLIVLNRKEMYCKLR